MDGVSMAYTFADSKAPGRKKTQYFENNRSRGIYHDGWFACTFGPMIPWDTAGSSPKLKDWEANKALPIGGGLRTRLHPEDVITSPYKSWRFDATTTRMPEFTAPGLGKRSNYVGIEVEIGEEASGVLYALGGASGGLALYMDKGQLVYDYNMLIIERTIAKSKGKIASGKHKIEVDTTIARPGAAANVLVKVDGEEIARTTVMRTVPGAFTASETFDVGLDLGSPVSLDYFDRAPFKFDGKIEKVTVELK
jgi:arylsulfatase